MQPPSLLSIFLLFLKLGSTGFGGPIALIALMEQECNRKRKWLSIKEFNERFVFCKLLPGAIAVQMAVWIGFHVRGRLGGLFAGTALILPSFVLILLLSISYASMIQFSSLSTLLQGMEVGALIVIADSVWKMSQPYLRRIHPWIVAACAIFLMLRFPRWEPLIILAGGFGFLAWSYFTKRRTALFSVAPLLLLDLFWVHFKAALTVFGTGLAIIPVLQYEIVEVYHWMSQKEFLSGIAFGQITPGPVTITSAFVGYRTAGFWGSLFAVIGMYSPGFLIILFVVPMVFERLKHKPWLLEFQEGAIPAVIGCIAGALYLFGQETIINPLLGVQLVVLATVAFIFKIPGWAVILSGSLLNWIVHKGTALLCA